MKETQPYQRRRKLYDTHRKMNMHYGKDRKYVMMKMKVRMRCHWTRLMTQETLHKILHVA